MSSKILSGLLSLLKDDNSFVRSGAASALGKLGKKSNTVLPALVQWIDRWPDDVPIGHAIDALRSILE
jgi:HEAT repeats